MSLARSRAVMVHPQHAKNARTAGHIQKLAVKVRSPTSYCIETLTNIFHAHTRFFTVSVIDGLQKDVLIKCPVA